MNIQINQLDKNIGYLPTKLYILRLKETNDYYAVLNNGTMTNTFTSLQGLFEDIKKRGFYLRMYGSMIDNPIDFEEHLRSSRTSEFSDVVHEIELGTVLDTIRNILPEEFL